MRRNIVRCYYFIYSNITCINITPSMYGLLLFLLLNEPRNQVNSCGSCIQYPVIKNRVTINFVENDIL